jgi:hypothetical protein
VLATVSLISDKKQQLVDFGSAKLRERNKTYYQGLIPWNKLGILNPKTIIFDILIEDDDGLGRESAMKLDMGK